MDQRWARGPGTPETRPCSCETARAWHVGWTLEPAPPRPRPEPVFRERFTHTVVSEGGSLAPPAGGACTWLLWPPWQRGGSCAKKGEKENCCDHSKGGRKLSPAPIPLSPRSAWFPNSWTPAGLQRDSKASLCGGNARLGVPNSSVAPNLRCPAALLGLLPFPVLARPPPPHLCPPFRVWVCCRCSLGDTWQNLCPQLSAPPLLCLTPPCPFTPL